MANFVKVASVNEIAPGQGKCVMAGDRELAVFNVNGTFHAIDNTCPHQGGPLGDGELDGTVVTCPWHGWRFDVSNGTSPIIPGIKLSKYEVKVEGDDVLVGV
jgi:nitrite reductase/ring-hydroxylating ferredoxin subunit